MEKNNIFPFIFEDLPLKFSLCYFSTINISTELNIKDPIYNLLQDKDLEHILKFKEGNITKYFYFNRKNINNILFDSNNNIHFEYYENNNNLSFYFYLLLLIKENPDILNYSYDQKYIKKIYDEQEQNKDKYKKIIISKIIIELSNDFKDTNDFINDENEQKINKIIDKNLVIMKSIIKDSDINNKWTIEEIISKKIDEIYIDIINEFIVKQKLEKSEKIIKELDLENINLTKTMIDGLFKTLNNKDYIKDYIITNKEDLLNNKKNTFYYVLLKYILKTSFYIYQIPFLLKTKKNIKDIIKNNKKINVEGNDIHKKIKYIVKKFGYSDKCISVKKKVTFSEILLKICPPSSISRQNSNMNLSQQNSNSDLSQQNLNIDFSQQNSTLNISRQNSQMSQDSSNEPQKIEKISFLHVINFAYNLILDNDINENLTKDVFIDENFKKKLKEKNYLKIEENKLKEIITNIKFKNLIYNANENNKKINLEELIEEVFYFDDYKDIKPQNTNEKSISKFKEWIQNYKPDSNKPD